MKITLEKTQKERLRSAGLINVTNAKQKARGITAFIDPVSGAEYLFSPRGYAYRRSYAGLYQLNPRFSLNASKKTGRTTKATVRTNDSGAQTELVLKGVRSFRNR